MTNAPTPAGMARCAEVPLHEQLRRVPRGAIYRWDNPSKEPWDMPSRSVQVGLLAHQAADILAAQPSAGAEPVGWIKRTSERHPIGLSQPSDWRFSPHKPALGEGSKAEWFDVFPVSLAHPAPVHAASELESGAVERLRKAVAATRDCSVCDGDGKVQRQDPPYGIRDCGGCDTTGKRHVLHDGLRADIEAILAALTREALDWTAATEAAWAENNTKEAPAATGAGAGEALAGFNGGYNEDGSYRWHKFNPDASPLEKKQVELDCMTRRKEIQTEQTRHHRLRAEALEAELSALRAQPQAREEAQPDSCPCELTADDCHPDCPHGKPDSDGVVEALRHYACSCEPGHCAMSDDDTDVPVDEVLCGRRAAVALAALAPVAVEGGERDKLREVLAWYGEQARLARLIHSEGDIGRAALADDGGKRAQAALRTEPTGGGEG